MRTPQAVMMSIQPKWCDLIIEGKKTVELRKSKPSAARVKTPFTAYVYCTQPVGKVIGSFTCTGCDTLSLSDKHTFYYDFKSNMLYYDFKSNTFTPYCLTVQEAEFYLCGHTGYGWHINDLVLYDRTKSVEEFGLKRPPQSWCYVYKTIDF